MLYWMRGNQKSLIMNYGRFISGLLDFYVTLYHGETFNKSIISSHYCRSLSETVSKLVGCVTLLEKALVRHCWTQRSELELAKSAQCNSERDRLLFEQGLKAFASFSSEIKIVWVARNPCTTSNFFFWWRLAAVGFHCIGGTLFSAIPVQHFWLSLEPPTQATAESLHTHASLLRESFLSYMFFHWRIVFFLFTMK